LGVQVLLQAQIAADVLKQECGVTPCVGVELEWYLRSQGDVPSDDAIHDYLQLLRARCEEAGVQIHSCDNESGAGQVEAALHMQRDMPLLLQHMHELKTIAQNVAMQYNLDVSLDAKPYADDYGSALHVHVHVENADGENLFTKKDSCLSEELRFSLSGLLRNMAADMIYFAPQQKSHDRFVSGLHSPVNVSWGYNNRTTALRIPDGTNHYTGVKQLVALTPTSYRRIEHRVAGADADVDAVIAAVLRGVMVGLQERIEPPEPIHGDAAAQQYASQLQSFFLGCKPSP